MKIVKPKDEEIEAVLLRAEALSKVTISASDLALFEAWFGKPLMNPQNPTHYNGPTARRAWEAWQMARSLTRQTASYASGVKCGIEWMLNGGPAPLPLETN